jgi:hypothetical protein
LAVDHVKEWESCISQIDKFEGYLNEARKYGFTLISGLITASSFLGLSSDNITSIQDGVIIVNMVLVIVLAWLDAFYQNTQSIAAMRAQYLEQFKLRGKKLITQMFDQNGIRPMSWILVGIYYGFLIALFLLGQYAALSQTANAAFAFSNLGMSVQTPGTNNDTEGAQNASRQQLGPQESFVIAFIFTLLALTVIFVQRFVKQNKVNKSRELIRLYGRLDEINKLSGLGIEDTSNVKTKDEVQHIKERIKKITGVKIDSVDFVKGIDNKSRNYAKECEESISRLLREGP